MNFYW